MGEIVGGDLLYLPDDLGEGAQQPACKEIADQGCKTDPYYKAEQEDLIQCLDPFQAVVVTACHYYDEVPSAGFPVDGDGFPVADGKVFFAFFLYFLQKVAVDEERWRARDVVLI